MKRHINWELVIKTVCFGVFFVIIMLILQNTFLSNTIKEITSKIGADIYEPPLFGEWGTLFLYRISIYFGLPLIVTIIELLFIKRKGKKECVLTNLEAQFLSFSIINGIFYLLSLDYVFKSNIFSLYDSLTSLLLFMIAILFDKRLPHIFLKEKTGDSLSDNQ